MSKAAELAALIGSQTALSNRNMIINGAMQVSQRGTSSTGFVGASAYLTVDRFKLENGSSGTFTVTQATDAPTGFANSLKFDCTTADSSPDYFLIVHRMEGQNLQHLQKGTSSAKKTTLSFHVKSNKTGTYQVNLRDMDNSRLIGATYSISSANTWEKKIVTFAGDTSGVLGNDNGNSLSLEWWLASGSTYNSGAVPTAWEAIANGDRAAGLNVAIGASTDDEFLITGVQLEVGEQATPFEHRSVGDELKSCQRFFCKSYNQDRYPGNNVSPNTGNIEGAAATGNGPSTANRPFQSAGQYPVTMRTNPTITLYHITGTSGKVTGGSFASYDGSAVNIGDRGFNFHPTGNVSNSDNEDHYAIFTADAEL